MKKTTLILILFGLFIFLTSCKTDKKDNESEQKVKEYSFSLTNAQIANGKVILDSIKQVDIEGVVDVSGMIEFPPTNKAIITSLLNGNVRDFNLIEGQSVQKGQTLLNVESLEFIDIQQEYAALGEQLNFFKNDYERQLKLYNENVNSEKKYLQAESVYKSSLAKYNGLSKKIQLFGLNPDEVQKGNYANKMSIRAPFKGVVSKINMINGTPISNNQSILEIVNTGNPHLTLQVFENDIASIRTNQIIRFKDPNGEAFRAKIHLISPAIDPDTKTVQVHAELIEKGNFYDGMFVSAQITTASKKEAAIPINAILTEGSTSYVILLIKKDKENYFFNKMPVEISTKNEKYAVITNADRFKDKLIIIEGANMIIP